MKKNYMLFVALALAAATSCTSDDDAQGTDTAPDGAARTVTLTASTPEPDGEKPAAGKARVGLTKKSSTAATFYWQDNDKILVQTKTTDGKYGQAEFGVKSNDRTSATFEGELTGSVGTYAVYPYNASHKFDTNTEKELTYNLPSSYTYTEVESGIFSKTESSESGESSTTYRTTQTNIPMLGTITDSKVAFKILGGLAVIRIDQMPATEGTLTVTADQKLSGDFTVADMSATDAAIATATATTDADKTVTFSFSGATEKSVGVFFLPLATGNYTNMKIVLDCGSTTKTLNCGSLTVERRNVTAINFTTPDYSGVELGDIMLSDGTLVKASSITSEQKAQAIGVVAYLYGETNACSSKAGTHGLVMALKQPGSSSIAWRTSNTAFGTACGTLKAAYEDGTNGLVLTDNVINSADNISVFPIFNAIKTFRTEVPAPTAYTTDWYIPSMGEWIDILSTNGIGGVDVSLVKSDATSRSNSSPLKLSGVQTTAMNNINDCLKVVGSNYYTALFGCPYWTSTERADGTAFGVYFGDALYFNIYGKTATDASRGIRGILAF